MIDSILNRKKQSIILDRLLYKDLVYGNILITNLTTIQKHAVHHFQQYALPKTAPPPMNERWSEQFALKSYIQAEWYKNIMVPPTWDEWIVTIRALPNDKACGLSSIHNEFYKKAGQPLQQLTWKMAQMCFTLERIPDDWKQAHIYPIPKPMDWQCDITKTRPLTLLDTMKKAVMKIITNRLSNIMAKYGVLKGNNFAGLPGGLTELSIKIMNMILEDAKEHNKPV